MTYFPGTSVAQIIETECQRWFNHINNLPCTPPDMITVEDCSQAFYEDCGPSVPIFMDCLIENSFCVDGELDCSGIPSCEPLLDCESGRRDDLVRRLKTDGYWVRSVDIVPNHMCNYGLDVRIARFHNIFGPYG